MAILITVDVVSRRNKLDSFPRHIARPWSSDNKKPWTLDRLCEKAATAFKVGQGLTGAVYFEKLDAANTVSYGGQDVIVILGRIRRNSRDGMNTDLSGVVEVRICGVTL